MSSPGYRRNLPISEELIRAIISAVDDDMHGTRTETICERLDQTPQRLGEAFEFVKEKGILYGFGGLWFHPERYAEAANRFLATLADAHRLDPSNGAVPPRVVAERAQFEWTHKASARIAYDLISSRRLKGDEDGVRLPEFVPRIGVKQEITLSKVAQTLTAAGFCPPVGAALAVAVNLPIQALNEILRVGEQTGRVVPMENDIWTTPVVLDRAYEELKQVSNRGKVTIAEARTALDASRRYAHAFMVRLAEEGRAEPGAGEWQLI